MTTIYANGLLTLDPADKRVLTGNWDARTLETGVLISSSTWTITVIHQLGATALTKDNEAIQAGNRKTQVRLDATTATDGDRYLVANRIVTNESPAQQIEREITVLVQNQ